MTSDEPAGVERIRIGPLAFLKSMLAIAWNAFRHPLSHTTIDLSTGKVIRRV
jgi:hypothetical protein